MKNIILSAALLVAFSISSFAKDKNANPKLLQDLSSTFKTTQVHWVDKAEYKQATFKFKNKAASAFYSLENDELIGFGIEINKTDLPEDVTKAINSKYDLNQVGDAMMFITPDGYINYFVRVHKNNRDYALKVTPSGHVSVYAAMPAK